MAKGTFLPRPGVTCSLNVVFETGFADIANMTDMEIAEIEGDINETFAEAEEYGDIPGVTFRSDVSVRPGFVIVSTDASSLDPETLEEMRKIVENRVGGDVGWLQIDSRITRKRMGTDFL